MAVHDHSYGPEVCFLCGDGLTQANRSDEHIFPRWVQRDFGIRDMTIWMLNGYRVAYRSLTIPCCTTCNNEHLSGLEQRVKRWLAEPVKDLSTDQRLDVFLWATKILFGLIYRQLFTAFDPRERAKGPTFTPEGLKHFDQMHRLLQGIRSGLTYRGPTDLPGTFCMFEVQCPETTAGRFDWQDNPFTQTLYVRLGTRAILLCHDGGAQMLAVGDVIRRHQARALHPLQMEELAAKFLYKATTQERWPIFTMADDGRLFVACRGFDYPDAPSFITSLVGEGGPHPTEVVSMAVPHPADDGRPLFGEWKREEFFALFSRSTGLPVGMLGGPGGTTATWLITPDGDDLILRIADEPYPLRGAKAVDGVPDDTTKPS